MQNIKLLEKIIISYSEKFVDHTLDLDKHDLKEYKIK